LSLASVGKFFDTLRSVLRSNLVSLRVLGLVALLSVSALANAAVVLPAPDVIPSELGILANRTSLPIQVDISPATHGQWSDDGLSWQLEVHSTGAKALHLGFSSLDLPADATVRLQSLGGTDKTWPATRLKQVSWLPAGLGDQVTLTVARKSPEQVLKLHIFQVNYGYKSSENQNLQKAGSCQVNTSCSEGDGWRDETQSVMRIDFVSSDDGSNYSCTGVLLHNTAANAAPYILTAEHCINTASEAQSVVAYWNYELSNCGAAERPAHSSLDGVQMAATLVASWAGSDFSLIRLLEKPNDVDSTNDVHYAGWDRRSITPKSGVTIHHPSAGSKKISYEFDPLRITPFGADRASSDANFLRVADWDVGTTKPGSSGGGLWNGRRRVVGQLFGGEASCKKDEPDWYGRLASSWRGGGTPASRLSDWLDPAATGAECLNGDDPATMAPHLIETDCGTESGGVRNPEGAKAGLSVQGDGDGGGGAPWGMLPLLAGLLSIRRLVRH
jgi:lysyl endopeptidase